MRVLIIFILGLLIGAAAFHAYYLNQAPAKRCGWDHPFDDSGRKACVPSGSPGYTKAARGELDDLVGNVSR
jgi:hypothetical protein